MNKKIILILLSIQAFIDGALGQYLAPGALYPPSTLPMMLVGALLVFMWYHYDTQELMYRRSAVLNIMVVGITILALPYYFFRSRGLKKGALFTLYFIVAFAVWGIIQSAGIAATEFLMQG